MKVNDILVSKWGYEQTNVEFYKVIKIIKTMVTIQELEKIRVDNGDMSGWEMPLDKTKEEIIRRKIHNNFGEEFVYIEKYIRAKIWNNKKECYTSYC